MPSMKTELKMLFAVLLMTVCLLARAEEQAAYDMANPGNLLSGHLYAESALLIDEDSGETLFSKNSKIRMYPASTTKIMTLMLALESDVPLDAEVTIPREAARIEEGSSVVPVYPGDVMSFSDLLYGFMLSSGNDGANAIAVLVDGNIDAFVENMNRRASELGCQGTHYVNPHGYHDPEHYTTASDLAIIARAAMRDPEFRKIVAAPDWTMHIRRNGSTVETRIISRNTLLQSGEKYYYPACTGIKTGHHNKAGWCFVGSAQREGMRLICVVLNCREEMSKWYDAARLFEYGFTRYEPVTLGALLEALERRQGDIEIENADPNDAQGGRLSLDMGPVSGGEQTLPLVADSTASYEN
ncbi:MAG: D-alanyl-D-alanine carboxypeptidase, partial [Clostridia bacterium]|nr:D-alanyl-D-alanine carboxypeptidase [Clostridia bacterium]